MQSKTRPCRICKKWFRPHPRSKGRQRSCSDPDCQRERHRRNCEDWRHRNPGYDLEDRLRQRLKKGKETGPYRNLEDGIDDQLARDALGSQQYVIIEEIVKVLQEMARDSIMTQLIVSKGKNRKHAPNWLRDDIAMKGQPP